MLKRIMLAASLSLIAVASVGAQANNVADTSFNVSKVNDHLFVVTGRVGLSVNFVVSAGADGVLLVDAGSSGTAGQLGHFLDSLTDGPIKSVITSHPHDDHYAGNQTFGPDVRIIADSTAAERMSGKYFSLPPSPGSRAVDMAIARDTSIFFNGEEIRLIHVPKTHTDGDLMVFFTKSKVLCAGDLVFADIIPFVDLASGGDVQNYVANTKHLMDTLPPDVKIVPGHGRIYNRDDLKAVYDMMTYTTGAVKEARSQNRTAEQVLQDPGLSRWAAWDGSQRITQMSYWIPCIFRSLEGAGLPAPPSICVPITETIVQSGIDSALALYSRLKNTRPNRYDFEEDQLNILGYELLNRRMMPEAKAIFNLNCSEHPESGNVFDSMGEFYMNTGERDLAIQFYEKSLEKNPENTNAVAMLKRLKDSK